jgi:hypothetical protein
MLRWFPWVSLSFLLLSNYVCSRERLSIVFMFCDLCHAVCLSRVPFCPKKDTHFRDCLVFSRLWPRLGVTVVGTVVGGFVVRTFFLPVARTRRAVSAG